MLKYREIIRFRFFRFPAPDPDNHRVVKAIGSQDAMPLSKEIWMQKVKYFLGLVVVVVLVTFIYQNNEYFMAEQQLGLDLYFVEESVELPNLFYFATVFVVGFLAALLVAFSYGRKKRKTIRELNEKITADKKRIDELESRLASSQGTGKIRAEDQYPGSGSGEQRAGRDTARDENADAMDVEFSRK